MELEKKPLHIYVPKPSSNDKRKILTTLLWLFSLADVVLVIVILYILGSGCGDRDAWGCSDYDYAIHRQNLDLYFAFAFVVSCFVAFFWVLRKDAES